MVKGGIFGLVGVYLCVLLVASVCASVIYQCVRLIDAAYSIQWVHYLAEKPLCQYVDRLRAIGFSIVVFMLLKKTRDWRSWRLNTGFKYYFCAGISGCLLWLILFGIVCYFIPYLSLRPTMRLNLIGAFCGSFLLACFEEMIFRGFIWDVLLKKHSVKISIVFSSFLFALLHFSMCREGDSKSILLKSLQCAGYSILEIPKNFSEIYFCCLFFLSILLVQLRLKTGTLWSCIGFHQGLVFILFLLRKRYAFNSVGSGWWGNGRLTDSWFVVIVLLLLNIIFFVYNHKDGKKFCMLKNF